MALKKKTLAKPAVATGRGRAGTKVQASFTRLSHEEPVEEDLQIVIHGKTGVGKSFLAATISEFFPKGGWTTKRHTGDRYTVLEDMYWIAVDKKALAGLAERGLTVPSFPVRKFMRDPDTFKAAGFSTPPNPYQAVEFALKEAVKNPPKFLVIDTVSVLDRLLELHRDKEAGTDSRKLYKLLLRDHLRLWELCGKLPFTTIFCCHSKVTLEFGDESEAQKARKEMLETAGGGLVMPDITGKGALAYKGDAALQLAVFAEKARGRTGHHLERYVSPIRTRDHETKNRWELSLDEKEEPHLGKILDKIRS